MDVTFDYNTSRLILEPSVKLNTNTLTKIIQSISKIKNEHSNELILQIIEKFGYEKCGLNEGKGREKNIIHLFQNNFNPNNYFKSVYKILRLMPFTNQIVNDILKWGSLIDIKNQFPIIFLLENWFLKNSTINFDNPKNSHKKWLEKDWSTLNSYFNHTKGSLIYKQIEKEKENPENYKFIAQLTISDTIPESWFEIIKGCFGGIDEKTKIAKHSIESQLFQVMQLSPITDPPQILPIIKSFIPGASLNTLDFIINNSFYDGKDNLRGKIFCVIKEELRHNIKNRDLSTKIEEIHKIQQCKGIKDPSKCIIQ